ncbi:MAG: flagellar basal body-associated FliL family protein [Gammaproteobacteria bacterium]
MAEPEKEEEAAEAPRAAPRWRTFALIGVGVLALMGASVGTTLLLVRSELHSATPAGTAATAQTAPASTPAQPKSAQEKPAPGPEKKPIYLPIDPAFVVNFQDHSSMRFLQIGVEVMAREQKVIDAVTLNLPQIRDRLVMLFSSQTYDAISTLQGKEKLRAETLKAVQQVMEKEIGEPGVEAVYFTSFVMQ